jgi:hypothetical protein
MKKILIFIVAMIAAAGLTITGCKKGEEVKPVPKAEYKKGKKSATTKKKASSKKSTNTKSTKKKSSQKKEEAGPII